LLWGQREEAKGLVAGRRRSRPRRFSRGGRLKIGGVLRVTHVRQGSVTLGTPSTQGGPSAETHLDLAGKAEGEKKTGITRERTGGSTKWKRSEMGKRKEKKGPKREETKLNSGQILQVSMSSVGKEERGEEG